MSFLVPAVLAGAAAVAAPIAIHLLNKTRVRTVRWAAMRFVLESLQKNQRRIQVEDLILLLLRCLFIVLLALAFARFVLNPGGALDAGGSGPVAAVILLDQSASMEQSDGFQTRFDQARDAAAKRISEMGGGSQVALFLVGSRVNQVVPRPTANLALVRRALDVAAPTDQTSDMGAAIRLALDALRPFAGARKEILAFSDNQAAAWTDLEKIQKLLDGEPDVELVIVNPGAKAGEDNLAITALRPESGVLAAAQLSGFLVEVSNFGSVPASGVRVTLALGDSPPVDEAVLETLEPGKSRMIRMNVRFPHPGFFTLRATIPADRLPADNERSVAVRVIEHMNATIVIGDPKVKSSRDGFFLANALIPVPASRQADYYLQVETVAPAWLQSADLARQAVVFLSNVPKLDEASAKNLEAYVRDGGSLVIFPGSDVRPGAYNEDPVLAPMLPAKLGAPIAPSPDAKSLAWQGRDYSHPVTALWNDSSNGNLGTVRATGYFPLILPPAKEAASAPRVIVEYADGTPAAVEGTYGRGRVVLFSSPATTGWGNLPIHPNFVPLLQRLLGFLASDPDSGALNLGPGGIFQTRVPEDLASRELTVMTPSSSGKPRPAGRVELVNQEAVVRFRDTSKIGAYRFFVAGAEDPVAAFAVQMDPKESDLRMLPQESLAALGRGAATATDGPGAEAAAAPAPVRREFWIFFICGAFAVALLEMALAHRFSFSK